MSDAARRIGITMRVVQAEAYPEGRDALARQWWPFLQAVLPEANCVPVPNLGRAAVDYAQRWELDGLILTGGDDLGRYPERDETERALLETFLARGLPVAGVCRGFQLMQDHFGGPLIACDTRRHVAARHPIRWSEEAGLGAGHEVNSFHAAAVAGDALAAPLQVLALSEDGLVEAAWCARQRLLALMWHPEREPAPTPPDRHLFRRTFGYAEGDAR